MPAARRLRQIARHAQADTVVTLARGLATAGASTATRAAAAAAAGASAEPEDAVRCLVPHTNQVTGASLRGQRGAAAP